MEELLNSLPGPMKINGSIFVIAAIFLVLLVILNKLVFQPMVAILNERQRKIDEGAEAQKTSMTTVEESLNAYQAKVLDARKSAQRKRNKILQESEMVREETIHAAREQAFAKIQAAVTELDEQVDKAKLTLKDETHQLAQKIVSSVLARAS